MISIGIDAPIVDLDVLESELHISHEMYGSAGPFPYLVQADLLRLDVLQVAIQHIPPHDSRSWSKFRHANERDGHGVPFDADKQRIRKCDCDNRHFGHSDNSPSRLLDIDDSFRRKDFQDKW